MHYTKLLAELNTKIVPEYILTDEPMRKHTTIKIGGNADVLIMPRTEEELAHAIKACRRCKVPFVVLGNGSNIVVEDAGIEGAVISTSKMQNKMRLTANGEITVSAGAQLGSLALFAKDRGLTGFEFAYGIPGTAGGAVYMNSGAYNGEMANIVQKVTCIDENGEIVELDNSACNFGYRKSVFHNGKYIILNVTFKLTKGNTDLIMALMEDHMKQRKAKQPIDFPSAGSVFKRPLNNYAGKLIEEAGLKGASIGGAQVSRLHAGFIINFTGKATAKDFHELVDFVKDTVLEKSGVKLECEIIFIGRE